MEKEIITIHTVYLALGSNLGNRSQVIYKALDFIRNLVGSQIRVSAFYKTMPEGFSSVNYFLNAVCSVQTTLNPSELLRTVQQIELLLGRTLKSKDHVYHDRIIDIDILMYDDLILHEMTLYGDLQIPHPGIAQRLFVLEPFCEIAPDTCHPVLHQTMLQLKCLLQDSVSE